MVIGIGDRHNQAIGIAAHRQQVVLAQEARRNQVAQDEALGPVAVVEQRQAVVAGDFLGEVFGIDDAGAHHQTDEAFAAFGLQPGQAAELIAGHQAVGHQGVEKT